MSEARIKLASTNAGPSGRVPPNSIEAEESVLGGIMLDNQSINDALQLLTPEDFYRAPHRSIFEAMVMLSDRRDPIDVITLSHQLRQNGTLEACGGMEALSRLAALVPSSANVGFYARNVKEMSVLRRVIHEASEVIQQAFTAEDDIETFLDSAEQRILSLSDYRVNPAFHKVGDVVQDSLRAVEQRLDQKGSLTGVTSGFSNIDHFTSGLQPSDLIILAARPSMGKTSLALSIAQRIGIDAQKPVAVFSLEMSKEQLVLRMLCAEARVDNYRVRTGNLGDRDFPKLVDAASKIAEAPIFIDDTPALTITELRAKSRRLHREHPLSLILVDYLQLLRSPMYAKAREQEISDISRSLKALAKELNVPVIALSQLNRSVESRDNKRPVMSDLRESGAIEQDADIIMFIYRDEVYHPETEDKGVAEIILSKHRNGPIGTARLLFAPEFTRFDDLDEAHQNLNAASPNEPAPTGTASDELF